MRRADLRRLYLWQHPLAFFLALGAVAAGLVIAFSPRLLEETTVGQTLPNHLDSVWAACFTLGGAATAGGMWRLSRIEAVGCWLLAASFLSYGICVISASNATYVFSAFNSIATGLAFGVRGLTLTAGAAQGYMRPWNHRS